jgi:MoaA/NifB/PqqE/SkfB family radical SAM enzyme
MSNSTFAGREDGSEKSPKNTSLTDNKKAKRKSEGYKVFREKKLNEVFLFVTSRCNSRCKTCFYHDFLNSNQDMTFEQIKHLSETAPDFRKLWLSGGEPFLRNELAEIIKLFYDNNHIKEINLPTNGLSTERIVEKTGKILEYCPDLQVHLNFSLDGLGKTHDKIRGVPGNFKKTIRTMELVKEKYGDNPNLLINVATVITPEGYHEAFDLGVYLLKKELISTQFFEIIRGDTKDPSVKNLTTEQIRELRRKVYPLIAEHAKILFKHFKGAKRKIAEVYYLGFVRFLNNIQDANFEGPSDWKMRCTAGETTIVFDHNGDFRSCEMREPIGNMRDYDYDLTKAFKSDRMKQEIEEIGGGKKANCWCTHGCWITSSLLFSPRSLLFRLPWAYHKAKGDLIDDFKLPDIDTEAIENYEVEPLTKEAALSGTEVDR